MQLEVARGAVQQQGLLQPCIIRLCITALRIKPERLFVALSFEMIVALFLKVLRDLFISRENSCECRLRGTITRRVGM